MNMLSLHAELCGTSEQAPVFLGTALHGLFERALNQHAHELLNLLKRGEDKLYVVHAPAVGAQLSHFRFGIALFAELAPHWQSVVAALSQSSFVAAGGWRADVSRPAITIMDSACAFHAMSSLPNPVNLPTLDWLPPSTVHSEPVDSLALEFVTPLRLTTSTKRLLGAGDAPPSLESLVKSVLRRMSYLEPGWSAAFALQDADWAQIKAAQPIHQTNELAVVRWPHHRLEMALYGRVGTMRWASPLSSRVVRLLDAGQWLCVGQGTAMGQGRYQLHCA